MTRSITRQYNLRTNVSGAQARCSTLRGAIKKESHLLRTFQRLRQKASKINATDDTEYEVEKILDKKIDSDNRLYYLIQWKGESKDDANWTLAQNLQNCPVKLIEYHRKHPRSNIHPKIRQHLEHLGLL